MSAQLAGDTGSSNSFHARLMLAAGVSVTINAPTLGSLAAAVTLLEQTQPANEGNASAPAATAPAGKPASQAAAPSAQPAAAKAVGDAGNAASTGTPASAPPAAGGSAASGEQGNASADAPSAASSASNAAAGTSAISFDELKKAFLALSAKADGRAKCESVLKAVDPAPSKLSEAKPEQYPALMAAIQKASA